MNTFDVYRSKQLRLNLNPGHEGTIYFDFEQDLTGRLVTLEIFNTSNPDRSLTLATFNLTVFTTLLQWDYTNAELTNLRPGGYYYYRVKADNVEILFYGPLTYVPVQISETNKWSVTPSFGPQPPVSTNALPQTLPHTFV